MSDDLLKRVEGFLSVLEGERLPGNLEYERKNLLTEVVQNIGRYDESVYVPTPPIKGDDFDGDFEPEPEPEEQEEPTPEYEEIMANCIKSGPLYLKTNMFQHRKVTAAVYLFNLYLFKAKGNMNSNQPTLTFSLKDYIIAPKGDIRFTLTYKTYKNDVYELKGNDKRDRESWVSVLLKAATDATDASDLDNYDEFADDTGNYEDIPRSPTLTPRQPAPSSGNRFPPTQIQRDPKFRLRDPGNSPLNDGSIVVLYGGKPRASPQPAGVTYGRMSDDDEYESEEDDRKDSAFKIVDYEDGGSPIKTTSPNPMPTSPDGQPFMLYGNVTQKPDTSKPRSPSPRAVTPRAMSPWAMSPRAMSPRAMSPRAMSPPAAPHRTNTEETTIDDLPIYENNLPTSVPKVGERYQQEVPKVSERSKPELPKAKPTRAWNQPQQQSSVHQTTPVRHNEPKFSPGGKFSIKQQQQQQPVPNNQATTVTTKCNEASTNLFAELQKRNEARALKSADLVSKFENMNSKTAPERSELESKFKSIAKNKNV